MNEPTSPRTPRQTLTALLACYAPKCLLLVSANRLSAVEAFIHNHPQCRLAHSPAAALPVELAGQRFDLALFVDCLGHLPQRIGLQLPAGARNLNASRVAALVDFEASDWQRTDFFVPIIQNSERFQREGQTLTLYIHGLYEYKQAPGWLNARFWANPGNFGKYWQQPRPNPPTPAAVTTRSTIAMAAITGDVPRLPWKP